MNGTSDTCYIAEEVRGWRAREEADSKYKIWNTNQFNLVTFLITGAIELRVINHP